MGLKLGLDQLRFDSVPLGTKFRAGNVAASSLIPYLTPSYVWVRRRFFKAWKFHPPLPPPKKKSRFQAFLKKKKKNAAADDDNDLANLGHIPKW